MIHTRSDNSLFDQVGQTMVADGDVNSFKNGGWPWLSFSSTTKRRDAFSHHGYNNHKPVFGVFSNGSFVIAGHDLSP